MFAWLFWMIALLWQGFKRVRVVLAAAYLTYEFVLWLHDSGLIDGLGIPTTALLCTGVFVVAMVVSWYGWLGLDKAMLKIAHLGLKLASFTWMTVSSGFRAAKVMMGFKVKPHYDRRGYGFDRGRPGYGRDQYGRYR